MFTRDNAKKEWLKGWINSEMHELLRRDKDAI